MAIRYNKLFSLEKDLYTPGAPLIICAGSLLQDSITNNMLAQLKYKSVSKESISAVKVSISMFDAAGELIGKPIEHQYQDLNLERDGEFGSKAAVVLPSRNVRSFSVRLAEVVYASGERWLDNGGDWLPLIPRETLTEALGDEELEHQYQIRYGTDCKFDPVDHMGLWFCVCGSVNHLDTETNCHNCRRVYTALKDINIGALRLECSDRLKAEEEQAVIDKAENEVKAKKLKKIAAIVVPILLVAIILLATVPGMLRDSRAYVRASALLASKQFSQAAEEFTALGDYKDSLEQAEKNVPYQQALYIMERAEYNDESALSLVGRSKSELNEGNSAAILLYQAAAEQFEALDGYKDSAAMIAECRESIALCQTGLLQDDYDAAMKLLEKKEYSEAAAAFEKLGDYSNSKDMVLECSYRKAVALYEFAEKYNVRKISSSFSIEYGTDSIFSLSKDDALALGSNFVSDLRAACGGDGVDIRFADEAVEGLAPYLNTLADVFEALGNYSDSKGYSEKVAIAADYTREYYALLEKGDIYGAYDWLAAYDGEFENKEHWLGILDIYKPYCSYWSLYMGDPTLIPMTVDQTGSCGEFNTCVIIKEDAAILRISPIADVEYSVDFTAEIGSTNFGYYPDEYTSYIAAISGNGRFAYMKYGDSGLIGSCEYSN